MCKNDLNDCSLSCYHFYVNSVLLVGCKCGCILRFIVIIIIKDYSFAV